MGQAVHSLNEILKIKKDRMEHWALLTRAATALVHASQAEKDVATAVAGCEKQLATLQQVERYFAYPGRKAMERLEGLLEERDIAQFDYIVQRIRTLLATDTYRIDESAWNLTDDSGSHEAQPPADLTRRLDSAPPYFEVLAVDHRELDPDFYRTQVLQQRRPDDSFVYEIVQVASFEEAVVAALVNGDLQAAILVDGFPFTFGQQTYSGLRDYLTELLRLGDSVEADYDDYVTSLAEALYRLRPELDLFAITDRSGTDLARADENERLRRIFFGAEDLTELHLSILRGVRKRFETPFFSNLVDYANRPVGTFHALPVARGKSVFGSHWIRDMGNFYGMNLFLAESSATTGGLDSLLEPKGNIRDAQEKAARCFGADHTYFVTNGTSTANKIVVQGLCKPGEIVLVDRNCHKSHHYGLVVSGAQPLYLDAYPLERYAMYGGVPLRHIKHSLLKLKAEGKLDRVRMLLLTNCTFDGHVYNVQRVMEECLAIKPDLIFLWDEAWFSHARFSPYLRQRTGMHTAEFLAERFSDAMYRAEYEKNRAEIGEISLDNPAALEQRLLPDPDLARIRVYATQSTHKSLSALRQGSMIHVRDQDFLDDVEETFEEAFLTHTSTSPNQQIIASLDVARRQVELEGFKIVGKAIELAIELRNQVNQDPRLSTYFHFLSPEELVPEAYRESGQASFDGDDGWRNWLNSVSEDEFLIDPTRLTLMCGTAGFDGTQFKLHLADEWDIQLNKTSRNTVLLQSNINNTQSASSYLVETLRKIASRIDRKLKGASPTHKSAFNARVESLIKDMPDLPDFSSFHGAFRDDPDSETREGRMRDAFFAAYDEEVCEHVPLNDPEIDQRLQSDEPLVSANFVIPYPPGFPIMVPGQVITSEIITFMRQLDVKEIHGYRAETGLKLLKPSRLTEAVKK